MEAGNTPKEPTMAEIMEIAKAAQSTAEEAKTAAEAKASVAATVEEEAEAKGLEITEDQAKMIAGITIAELERRGAFPDPGEGGGEPPAPVEGEQPPPPVEGAPPVPPAPPAPPEQAPEKKSLAERFRGA